MANEIFNMPLAKGCGTMSCNSSGNDEPHLYNSSLFENKQDHRLDWCNHCTIWYELQ